jgi:hypothetical protein
VRDDKAEAEYRRVLSLPCHASCCVRGGQGGVYVSFCGAEMRVVLLSCAAHAGSGWQHVRLCHLAPLMPDVTITLPPFLPPSLCRLPAHEQS